MNICLHSSNDGSASVTGTITHARDALGARDDRWVNQFVVQDEFLDFIAAGRPATWPPTASP
ncbi:MAG: hypothetical protein HYV17_14920 [Xanthomonadales bacterium]|nr:hypothetical protein [Xanthomonadales bacterium]